MKNFVQRSIALVAGERVKVYEPAAMSFMLLHTQQAAIKVAIGNDSLSDCDAGTGIPMPSSPIERHVTFYNSTGAQVTVKYAFSGQGVLYVAQLIINDTVLVDNQANTIETPAALSVLKASYLIDNAAAVDKGGGEVGIPMTAHSFAAGEAITVANTVNYNGNYIINSQTTNEIVITATYIAETFDGTDDSVGLQTPHSIAADSTQKEISIDNTGSYTIWVGDSNVDAANKRGTPIASGDARILTTTAQLYLEAESGTSQVSYMRLKRV